MKRRFRNDLPPPPMPPKLLDIDTGGLQQYLDPGFAASIAKREEPNIEADAEGGMPIDVIGMYGYFDGDESSIMAPEVAPPLDPEDEALMVTAEQLKTGGPIIQTNFLRKTQYMTAGSGSAAINDPLRSSQARTRRESKPKLVPMARDDKENIKRNIQKAFDLAYPHTKADKGPLPVSQQEKSAWDRPVHPDRGKKSLKPVEFYPIIPDLEAVTAIGPSWNLLRFDKPPLPAVKGRRDDRIDAAFLMTQEHPERKREWDEAMKLYEADPTHIEHPGNPPAVWSLLLPRDPAATAPIKSIFNSSDPSHEDQSLLARTGEAGSDGQLRIPLERARFYSNTQSQDKPMGRHTRQVVVAIDKSTGIPVAHYYPIGQVNRLKSDRGKLGQSQKGPAAQDIDLEATLPDQVMVLPRDPNNQELANRYMTRDEYDPAFAERYQEIYDAANVEQAANEGDVPESGAKARVNDGAEDVDMTDADADADVGNLAPAAANGGPDDADDDED